MATKNSTIAKNTIFLSLRMIFVLFISLYTSRVFLNVLGIVDYGISNVVTGFVSMFGFLNTSLAMVFRDSIIRNWDIIPKMV